MDTVVTLGTRANPVCSEQPPPGCLWLGRPLPAGAGALQPGVTKTPLPPEQGVEQGAPESGWREALGVQGSWDDGRTEAVQLWQSSLPVHVSVDDCIVPACYPLKTEIQPSAVRDWKEN